MEKELVILSQEEYSIINEIRNLEGSMEKKEIHEKTIKLIKLKYQYFLLFIINCYYL